MKTKAIILFVIFALCLFSFVGCDDAIDKDTAKDTVVRFFKAVKAEDYAEATALLHPENYFDVEKYITDFEKKQSVDFQSDIVIKRFTGISSSVYDSQVGGARFALTMDMTVGLAPLTAEFEMVRNGSGYGIYSMNISR